MSMFNNNYNAGSSQFSGSQIGGGFVSNNNENFGDSNNFNNKPVLQKIPYANRKLSQITIKQIITAAPPQPDEHLVIDNVEISQVQMIAQIQSINVQTSHTTLRVNDYSGSLDIKQWNANSEEQPESPNLLEGTWVRIVGRINNFQGRCSINAFDIIPITNFSELTHHFTECIFAHLSNTTPKPKPKNNNNMNNMNNMNRNNNNNMNNSYNNNRNNGNNNGLPNIQCLVLNIINTPEFESNEQGCDVEAIFARLPNEDVNEIRGAIDELANAGHIYSTVDDDHYKYSGDQQ